MAYVEVAQQDKEEDMLEPEGEDIDIKEDVYGAVTYTVVFDIRELFGGDYDDLAFIVNLARFFFIFLLLVTNFTLQFGMIFYIYFYVCAPAIHKVQGLYQQYHSEIYEDGQFDQDKWDDKNEADPAFLGDLCNMVFSNFWFTYAVLVVWWLTMQNEFRNNERLGRHLWCLQSTHNLLLMIEQGDDEVIRVKALVKTVRFFLFLLMWLPKMIISCALLVLGTMWLVATDVFSDLILNAVSLEFVIKLDELIYDGMVPQTVKRDIANAKLWMPRGKATDAVTRRAIDVTAGLTRSFTYYVGIVVGAYVYLRYGQSLPYVGIFPGYADDMDNCNNFWKQSQSAICKSGITCFPIP